MTIKQPSFGAGHVRVPNQLQKYSQCLLWIACEGLVNADEMKKTRQDVLHDCAAANLNRRAAIFKGFVDTAELRTHATAVVVEPCQIGLRTAERGLCVRLRF